MFYSSYTTAAGNSYDFELTNECTLYVLSI